MTLRQVILRAGACALGAGLVWVAAASRTASGPPAANAAPVGKQAFANAPNVRYEPEPASGPYVVVVVDNHFHDIHPEDDPKIASDRPFVVRNEGRNLHNFTVVGTDISIDLRPDQSFTWNPLGSRLSPGTYTVVCRYHSWVGMTGEFIVASR
jgi:plastocyanin